MLQSRDKFKAGGTSLEVIRNPQKYLENHEAFELFELEDQITRGGKDKFRFDLKYRHKQTEGVVIFVDTKNYESLSSIFSNGNLDQLKAYFREITDFSQLRIVQQKRGGMTIEGFKNNYQKMLKINASSFYNTNQSLFTSYSLKDGRRISNPNLFRTLLDEIDYDHEIFSILKFTE